MYLKALSQQVGLAALRNIAENLEPIHGADVIHVHITNGMVGVTINGFNVFNAQGDTIRVSTTVERNTTVE